MVFRTPSASGCNITTANAITVTFPSGTNVNTASGTLNGTAITFTSRANGIIVFNPPVAVAVDTDFTLVFSSITNTSTSGLYQLSISSGNSTSGGSNTGTSGGFSVGGSTARTCSLSVPVLTANKGAYFPFTTLSTANVSANWALTNGTAQINVYNYQTTPFSGSQSTTTTKPASPSATTNSQTVTSTLSLTPTSLSAGSYTALFWATTAQSAATSATLTFTGSSCPFPTRPGATTNNNGDILAVSWAIFKVYSCSGQNGWGGSGCYYGQLVTDAVFLTPGTNSWYFGYTGSTIRRLVE